MTAEKLFEMIGDADAELIADASGENIRRKHPAWLRWGAAAACICILAAGALGIFLHPAVNGGGYAPGGSWPEGVDPKTASIAVYPATEKVQDVADATLRTLSEEEARQFEDLGKYLPRALPEGYWFVISEVRETTMKDGSVYHLLRATYSRSDPADFAAQPERRRRLGLAAGPNPQQSLCHPCDQQHEHERKRESAGFGRPDPGYSEHGGPVSDLSDNGDGYR